MLSYSPIRSADAAANYFAGYYATDAGQTNGEPPGQWHGTGAELLGLTGNVTQADLAAVLRGIDPRTGTVLLPEPTNPEMAAKARAGRDLTFSAPKSVSVAWALASPELRAQIEQAHADAVRDAVDRFAREHVFARRGAQGKERIAANPIIGLFAHSTSRANDPQVHTHAVFAAMAHGADGVWSRLDIDMRALHGAGAHYRAGLAEKLAAIGFDIRRDVGNGARDDGYFRIEGVPEALVTQFSARRAEIEKRLSESDAYGAVAASKIAKSSRAGKETPNRAENFVRWAAEARAHGFGAHSVAELATLADKNAIEREAIIPPTDAEIIARAYELKAALRDTDLERVVFAAAVGRESGADAEARLERIRAGLIEFAHDNQKTGRVETYYATPADVALADRLPALVAARRSDRGHAASAAAIEAAIAARPTIRAEQAALVRALGGDAGLAIAQGRAGTGKSYALAALREAYADSGYRVIGAAVQGKAAADLADSTGIDSTTIARLRLDLADGKQTLDARTVLVIEEAGMMASRDAAALIEAAQRSGAKIIMVGDTGQLPPVGAGRPMADAVAAHGADAELVEVVRQRDTADRAIAGQFRAGQAAQARDAMLARGQWHAASTHREAVRAAARGYVADRGTGGDALIVANTRADTRSANVAARRELRAAGLIGEDRAKFAGHEGREVRLAVGDRVLFRENSREYKNGTIGEVIAAESDRIAIRVGTGETAHTIALRIPERGALDAAQKAATLAERSGDPAQIARAREAVESAQARYDVMAERLGAIAYGHAITVHASQGATVRGARDARGDYAGGGNVHIVARDGAGLSRELAYVAASRNEGQAHVHLSAQADAEIVARMAARAEHNTLAGLTRVTPAPVQPEARSADGAAPQRDADAQARAAKPAPAKARSAERRALAEPLRDLASAQRARELARSALATRGTMPSAQQIKTDVAKGKATIAYVQGERLIAYADGRTYHPGLHGPRGRETEVGILNHKRAIVIPKYAIDLRLFGAKIQALRTGDRVLIGRETLAQKFAGAIKDRTDRGGIIHGIAARNEGWRVATFGERISAKLSLRREHKATQSEARASLGAIERMASAAIDSIGRAAGAQDRERGGHVR